MAITIELPDLASQTGFNLTRWTEILGDPDLAKVPDRIETDRGISSWLPHLVFAILSAKVRLLLIQFAPQGQTLPECPISTADGVKAIDVGWLDASRSEIGQEVLVQTLEKPSACNVTPFAQEKVDGSTLLIDGAVKQPPLREFGPRSWPLEIYKASRQTNTYT